MNFEQIIQKLPYQHPFLFVDELNNITNDGVSGTYTFHPELDFYKGHFIENPITPGVILTECCAQIGLVCLGIYLLSQENSIETTHFKIGFSSSKMDFLLPVFPGEKVVVTSKKIYFRFQKLRCKVEMHNEKGNLVCKGELDGMLITKKNA
ncbi:FabA/FabZ family ACP-dehydratase [Ascidiimonas sp. W6]|uniref:3-hydroxyacyl-ACP dehydratase FabZ family protein n=1 Tax=Ascidiimonas meishanensis TaxID=3128903 RepID=UPI0030ED8194